jgi:hypothetical protein
MRCKALLITRRIGLLEDLENVSTYLENTYMRVLAYLWGGHVTGSPSHEGDG